MVSTDYSQRMSDRRNFEEEKRMTIKEMIESGMEIPERYLKRQELIIYHEKELFRKEVKEKAWNEAHKYDYESYDSHGRRILNDDGMSINYKKGEHYKGEDPRHQDYKEEDDEEDNNLTYSQKQVKKIHSFHRR